LLDDLRLESIKAGEIIGATTTKFGVGGKIQPADIANGTIAEVAGTIAVRKLKDADPADIF